MWKWSGLLICVLSGWFLWLDAPAQEPGAGVIFFQHRQFKIPFKNDQKNVNITQVRLYVSSDQGRTWQLTATAAPEEQHFRFNTSQDGLFWFAVQTVDAQGKLYPPAVDDLKTNLKVIVDTVPPTVQVQPLQPRNGEVGVSWTVRDDNLDVSLPDAVQLLYRSQGALNWIPLLPTPGSSQHYWNPHSNGVVEVRVLARDRAGNIGEDKTIVSLTGGGNPPLGNPLNPERPNDPPKELQRKFVNRKQISLLYDLKDVGPSGVSTVELWYTLYKSRSWTKLAEYPIDAKNADLDQPKKLAFEVQEEGIYGITLVAKSGVGLGDKLPKSEDPPQFWIEVDLTKPVVQIVNVNVGTNLDKGKLTVQWTAHDRNLGQNPIRLSYAEQKDGPWNTFAEKLPNSNRYIWSMPEQQLPYQFYLRVEARDLAGNIGEAITPEKVKVDLSVPKAKIRDIEPSGK